MSIGREIEDIARDLIKHQHDHPPVRDLNREVDRKLTEFGLDVETSTPAELSQLMARDFTRWKSILDSIGYKPPQ